MPLTNAERQARYRERIRELAARGLMSPVQAQLLSETRRHIREWRRSIAAFDEGRMRLFTNHVDTSAEHIARLGEMIAQSEALLAQYDPDGLTTDGNVELGNISPTPSGDLLPRRWVTFLLDEQGRAEKLRLYDSESHARSDSRRPGCRLGRIADDIWSIVPVPAAVAYALVQPMANGWWRGLIAGWNDLPEQYALSRDFILAELRQVANEYVAQRVERGVPVAVSAAMNVANWECIPISFYAQL